MITVVGSFSIELRAKASDIPEAGEAILGETFTIAPGGKGLGQAVAARRLGSDVCLVRFKRRQRLRHDARRLLSLDRRRYSRR